MTATDAVLFLAHGTIHDNSELPEFLRVIRRGRPASDDLVRDMAYRYSAIGGSPLLRITEEQAAGVQQLLNVPCAVAMRLWHPKVEEVVPTLLQRGARRICLLPLAPFSVSVYVDAAQKASAALLAEVPGAHTCAVSPWGSDPAFVRAQASLIREHLRPDDTLIVTAHSLPTSVIAAGDRYATEVEACAKALASELERPLELAYQSQGAGGGEWLGPDLPTTLRKAKASGAKRVVLAPFGFLGDHVETLYDLDIDAQALAKDLALPFLRVPALNSRPDFIRALADLAQRALDEGRRA